MMAGGVDPKQAWEASAEAVRVLTGRAVFVPQDRRAHGRYTDDQSAWARKLACYVAVVGLGCSQRGLAPHARLTHWTIGAFLRDVEDRRDEAVVDGSIDDLFGLAAQIAKIRNLAFSELAIAARRRNIAALAERRRRAWLMADQASTSDRAA